MERDLRLAMRQGGDWAMVLAFFVLTVILFPFGVGPEPELLQRIASGVVWVTALLAALLSLERLFLADYEDGSLEALALMPLPARGAGGGEMSGALARDGLAAHPDGAGAGAAAASRGGLYPALVIGMVLGTPTLSLIGAIGASLTLGARRGGVLLSLLVLPLYIPVLIFGVAACEAAAAGFTTRPHFLMLAALLVLALPLAPFAAAAGLRQALE